MELVYSRTEHGGYPIYRMKDRIEVEWPGLGRKTYPNVRKTLLAVVNNDPDLKKPDRKDLHYSWDRYFRTGKYSRIPNYRVDIFDFFGDKSLSVLKGPETQKDRGIYISAPKNRGINLEEKAVDVRKLFYAGFAKTVIGMGYDPEDVLQEVYKGILVRNEGKCPFNPEKSSFGHYVHMVAGCIVSNYRRKFSRIEKNEVSGVQDENGERQDVACSKLAKDTPVEGEDYEVETLKSHLRKEVLSRCGKENIDLVRAKVVIEMVFKGYRNKEIITETGYSANWVSKFLKFARSVMKEVWP